MHFKKCSKCNQEIINTFEKCPYCGTLQNERALVYKVMLRFVIGMLIAFIYMHLFVGPKWISHSTHLNTVYLTQASPEIVTDEYRIKVSSVATLPPTRDQKERHDLQDSEVILEVDWSFEPLKNVELTSSPKLILKMHSNKDESGGNSLPSVILDDIEGVVRKTSGEDIVRNTNTFRVEKDVIEAHLLTMSIEADWHIDISSELDTQ